MNAKKFFKLFVLAAMLIAMFMTTSSAFAAGCGSSVTVVSGDTLFKVANRCGTTVSALRLANPELGSSNLIYPGQVLQLPGTILGTDGGYFIYIVARGDSLKGLATRFNTTVDAIVAANPEITNANVIYEGQWIKVNAAPATPAPVPPPNTPPPASGQIYYVQRGDTLRNIASRMSTTTLEILKVNPQIYNPNLIFVGQAITIPAGASSYIVQSGDTLKIIANRFGTTVENLLYLNPNIKNANLIYVRQVINIR
ncbi:MAG TPA: LysM peptidoglycan-binding domain-containing protein [Anaerolineales bacterium]|nr:LysM peptidoglycan-binding domain-containing protein [Anaerolineales bacterium]